MPPITSPEQDVVVLQNLPGYRFAVTALPAATGTTHPLGYDFDDRSIDVPNEWGSLWIRILDNAGNDLGGGATFAATERSVMCDTIDVPEEHRRKGIATSLYDLAEHVFGLVTEPSPILSEDAKAFWDKRRARIVGS